MRKNKRETEHKWVKNPKVVVFFDKYTQMLLLSTLWISLQVELQIRPESHTHNLGHKHRILV